MMNESQKKKIRAKMQGKLTLLPRNRTMDALVERLCRQRARGGLNRCDPEWGILAAMPGHPAEAWTPNTGRGTRDGLVDVAWVNGGPRETYLVRRGKAVRVAWGHPVGEGIEAWLDAMKEEPK